jgi:myosin-7
LGKNKIFLKENHDRYLEQMRADMYTRAVEVIQRGFRRIIFRKRMRKYRQAAIVIQKNWRAREPRIRFLTMQQGFRRLQAMIQSRERSSKYQILRLSIVQLQARCRGLLTRKNLLGKMSEKSQKMAQLAKLRVKEEQELKKSGHANWEQEAEKRYFTRVAALNRELKIEKVEEQKIIPQNNSNNLEEDYEVVDKLFDFLTELQTPQMKPKYAARQKPQPTFRVSRMISYLEAKSRNLKHIPSKLLSRPVNYYDSSTRL